MNRLFLIITLAALFWRVTSDCDTSNPLIDFDGPMGRSGIFPWLGVLNVYLYLDEKIETAVTGLVLIHKNFAITHADDVARIPDKVFLNNCSVMFIAKPDMPWYCQPKTYYLHPEYTVETFNSIALLELDFKTSGPHNLKPICWMRNEGHSGSNLFVTGYNDENYELEKVIYSVHEKEKNECRYIYDEEGLTDLKRDPVHYNCYYSKTMKHSCVWENGMLLVSNASSFFNLIGLAVHGPGCAIPGRFIELNHYYEWVSEIIFVKTEEMFESQESDKPLLRDVPLHEFYLKNPLRNTRKQFETYYYTDFYDVNILGEPTKQALNKTSQHIIKIFSFREKLEIVNKACTGEKLVFYMDFTNLVVPDTFRGQLTYKLALSDVDRVPADCIKVKVSKNQLSVGLSNYISCPRSWNTYFKFTHKGKNEPVTNPPTMNLTYMEVLVMDHVDEDIDNTPDIFLKKSQRPIMYPVQGVPPIPHLYPKYLSEPNVGRRRVKSYTLYFTFPFEKAMNCSVEFYSSVDISKAKYIWWRRAETPPENDDYKTRPPVPLARREFQKVNKKINNLINQNRKFNHSNLYNMAEHVARANFYKPAKVVAISSSDSRKPEEASVDLVVNNEIFNYIKESAIPRKLRQYSSDAAATTVFRITHSLPILIFIFCHKIIAYMIFNSV